MVTITILSRYFMNINKQNKQGLYTTVASLLTVLLKVIQLKTPSYLAEDGSRDATFSSLKWHKVMVSEVCH